MIYLDSCALVKLIVQEAETDALRAWLEQHDQPWCSSALLEIETTRSVARHAPAELAVLPQYLSVIQLHDLTPGIRLAASVLEPAEVRSLDAIHLATALQWEGLSAFISYDKRLCDAARDAGLPVTSPR